MQHVENLFRRCKGQVTTIKTVSGQLYSGAVNTVTDDYVGLTVKREDGSATEVFLFFGAMESMTLAEEPQQ